MASESEIKECQIIENELKSKMQPKSVYCAYGNGSVLYQSNISDVLQQTHNKLVKLTAQNKDSV
jgi:hypothetical protein